MKESINPAVIEKLKKKHPGMMTVSELQRAKFAMRTVIARFEK